MPTRGQLMAKVEKSGPDVLTTAESRRLKKLITLEDIKEYNNTAAMSID